MLIEFTSGPRSGERITVTADRILFGRADACVVTIADPGVSSRHCVIERVGLGYVIRDVGSTGGTRLGDANRPPIEGELPLVDGTTVFIGASSFVVHIEDDPTQTLPHSPALARLASTSSFFTSADDESMKTLTEPIPLAGLGAPPPTVDASEVTTDAASDPPTQLDLPVQARPVEPEPILLDRVKVPERHIETEPVIRAYPAIDQVKTVVAPAEGAEPLDAPKLGQPRSDGDDPHRTMLNVSPFGGVKPTRENLKSLGVRIEVPVGPIKSERTHTPKPGGDVVVFERPDTSHEPEPVSPELEARPRLLFLIGPHAERRVFLGKSPVVLGRAEACDVVLTDPMVSRTHARVSLQADGGYVLEPLKADNPPTVNGHYVTAPRKLEHGDIIGIGASVVEFVLPGPMRAPAGGKDATVMPRFCFFGQVLEQARIRIGRDPNSDLFLDDDDVERKHAEICFESGQFVIRDLSSVGTYIGGKRVVDQPIKNGDVAHIDGFQLEFSIEGARLTIDIAAPKKEAEPVFAPDLDGPSPYTALYRVALAADANPVRAPGAEGTADAGGKAKAKKKKRAWSPPRDVERSPVTRTVVAMAVLLTIAAVVIVSNGRDGSTFLRRPISPAHASAAFLVQAKATMGKEDRCVGCHLAFRGPTAERCAGCHGEKQHALRPLHASVSLTGKAVPTACTDCHTEHVKAPGPALIAGNRCQSCHEDRHARFKDDQHALVRVDPPNRRAGVLIDLKADLAYDVKEKIERLHERHESIERRCNNCHLTEGGFSATAAWSRCFSCHRPKEALSSSSCGDCHREHGGDWATPQGPATASTPPIPLLATFGTVLLLLAPLGLVLSFSHVSRVRREEADADRRWAEEQQAAKSTPAEGKFIHNINLEKCVGCASCVNACPNDVLELEPKRHKSTVVRFDDCKQCRACEQICPSGALTMAPAGAPPRMIELPDLDSNYETNIPGVYLIGEAAGKSLVKNANNLGYRVVQHMMHVRGIRAGSASAAGYDVEVVCVGSGPGGLATAITCFNHKLSHIVFEKDRLFASTIQTYPKKKELLAEPPEVKNIGPLPVWDSHKEEILETWNQELKKFTLDIRCGEEVRDVKSDGKGGFVVTTSKGTYTCLKIVLATGTRGNPRGLKIPGGDLDKVHYILVDAEEYDGKDVMVIGGGDSALEAAIALSQANNGSNRVVLSYRRASFERAKDRNKELIDKQVAAGRIVLHLETNPVEVRADAVVLETKDKQKIEIPNMSVYCMLGADPPVKWLKEIGVQYTKKPENWNPGPSDDLSFLELQLNAS